MSIENLDHLDATAQAALVRKGELSPTELVEAAIARFEERNQEVQALSDWNLEAARVRAASELSGPFAGVPFLVKDLIPYPGLRYSLGSRLFAAGIPVQPSSYSAAIDAAGLVVLGKTRTSELGLLGSTETLLEGETHNPWRKGLSSAGSSGGAAAAVACGMVPMAHASDGGGSIRIPASVHGLFGLKPSGGRVLATGSDDMNGLVCDHCVSWSVRDSAALLALTERSDGPAGPKVGFVEGPSQKRLRIGYYTQTLLGQEPTSSVRSSTEQTVALCRELGHELVESPPPKIDGRAVSDAFFTLAGAGISQVSAMMEPMLGRAVGDQDLEPFTLSLLAWFRSLPADAAPNAVEKVGALGAAMRSYLDRFDLVLCPTIPQEPHELGWLSPTLERELLLERTERLAGYTAIHNMAGVPAMSVPLGQGPDGLPLGSHFAGPVGSEATLLALAYELEEARPWKERLPFMASDSSG